MKRFFGKAAVILSLCVMIALGAYGTFAFADSSASVVGKGKGDVIVASETTVEEGETFSYSANVVFKGDYSIAGGLAFGVTDTRAYVFLVDRNSNELKFLKFTREDESSGWNANTLQTAVPFIGNNKTTDKEYEKIKPRVRSREKYNLRIEFNGETNKVRLFADDIERFRTDWNNDFAGIGIADYDGGKLGYQVFESDADFTDVQFGVSDTGYYAEPYRPQYHYTQPAWWNNDPNGMVYYNGYYHLFYQHFPFGKTWSDMYWGHARSRDLLHWENMPIALFPDGAGFAWSGSAIVDDNKLVGFFTREKGGPQEQVKIVSDDGGLTWTKERVVITTEQNHFYDAGNAGKAFRDPKVFKLSDAIADSSAPEWGMIIGGGRYQFFTSDNLNDWTYSSCLPIDAECPDIVKLDVDGGDSGEEKWAITMSSREYIIGTLGWNGSKITFTSTDGKDLTDDGATLADCNVQKMEYATDAYAAQTFYIDDVNAKYYGKSVSISWFSSPMANCANNEILAQLRDPWNTGFTIPVEYGIKKVGENYKLTQTPVSGIKEAAGDAVLTVSDQTVGADSENILAQVKGSQLYIEASVSFAEGTKFAFRVQSGSDGYTEVGYGEKGYYLDRTKTQNGGVYIPRFNERYDSNVFALGDETKTATFTILTDSGSVEVFAEDCTVPFYSVTFPSQSSVGAVFVTDGEVTVNSLNVYSVPSMWKAEGDTTEEECKSLRLGYNDFYIDKIFGESVVIPAFTVGGGEPVWRISNDNVTITPSDDGMTATVTAVKEGDTVITVLCDSLSASATVHVGEGEVRSDLNFTALGAKDSKWNVITGGALRGYSYGDGYLLSDGVYADFNVTALMQVRGGASAVVFRANEDMSEYYVANYDRGAGAIKLWRHIESAQIKDVELGRAAYVAPNSDAIKYSVRVVGTNIRVIVNDVEYINVNDEADGLPTEGYLGLNAFGGESRFLSVYTWNNGFMAAAGADLAVDTDMFGRVERLTDFTRGNAVVPEELYSVSGRTLTLKKEYLATLKAGNYVLRARSAYGTFAFTVTVPESGIGAVSSDITDAQPFVVSLGGKAVESVTLNGAALGADGYRIATGHLYIDASAMSLGENKVSVVADGKTYEFTVNVKKAENPTPKPEKDGLAGWAIALIVIGCVLVAGGGGFCLYWFVLKDKFFAKKKTEENKQEKKEKKEKKEEKENGGEH